MAFVGVANDFDQKQTKNNHKSQTDVIFFNKLRRTTLKDKLLNES